MVRGGKGMEWAGGIDAKHKLLCVGIPLLFMKVTQNTYHKQERVEALGVPVRGSNEEREDQIPPDRGCRPNNSGKGKQYRRPRWMNGERERERG